MTSFEVISFMKIVDIASKHENRILSARQVSGQKPKTQNPVYLHGTIKGLHNTLTF
jgi:hypothetical protein